MTHDMHTYWLLVTLAYVLQNKVCLLDELNISLKYQLRSRNICTCFCSLFTYVRTNCIHKKTLEMKYLDRLKKKSNWSSWYLTNTTTKVLVRKGGHFFSNFWLLFKVVSGATGHLILPLLALSWTRWTTPDFQCCLILYDTNPSNCPIILYSTIVQYCTNCSQFRLEIYFSIFFEQNLKITLYCGKKWNEIEKESFESFFFVFGIFWAKVLQNFILMWQNENIHVVYSNTRMTIWHFFTDTPMTWNMYHQFHIMYWKKK